MAWTSISTRLAGLPRIIAGPMVRRTTNNSVSVWIACKGTENPELIIYSDVAGNTVLGRKKSPTLKIGKSIHVAVITVTGLNLVADKIYYYDVQLAAGTGLAANGVLSAGAGGISKVVYGTDTLPSFILPADVPDRLRLLHGSCRKPHGGEDSPLDTDAMEAVDYMLDAQYKNPARRPQQLYLTGDQIYADDVSPLLLFMLRDAEEKLMGWAQREALPDPINPPIDMRPMHRHHAVHKVGFTSDFEVCGSHLFLLGEFYAMYLFAWSKELWPDVNDLPSFADYQTFAQELYQIARRYSPPVDDVTKCKEVYNADKAKITTFYNSLDKVRKAFANISTYMMFDDHEITDDWYLNRKWFDGLTSNGSRIIQNGLSAFAVFQAWGNMPADFEANKPKAVLTALEQLTIGAEAGPAPANQWNSLQTNLLPTLNGNNLEGPIMWSFSLIFAAFNVIVIDSRTNRRLYPKYPGLLSEKALKEQITDRLVQKVPNHYFTLVIAPAPVFGVPLLEELIQPSLPPTMTDFETWSADNVTFQSFLNELCPFGRVLLLSGDVHYSFSNSVDYWRNNKKAKFVNLIASSLKNSTGGTKKLSDAINNRIPDQLLGIQNNGIFVGWKNDTDGVLSENTLYTLFALKIGPFKIRVKKIPETYHVLPLREPSGIESSLGGSGGYLVTRQWVDPNHPPDLEYRITFWIDTRSDADREAVTPPPTARARGQAYISAATHRNEHTLVGSNALGEIVFSWSNVEQQKILFHRIWTKRGTLFKAFTIHVANFGIPDDTQKPSLLGRVE